MKRCGAASNEICFLESNFCFVKIDSGHVCRKILFLSNELSIKHSFIKTRSLEYPIRSCNFLCNFYRQYMELLDDFNILTCSALRLKVLICFVDQHKRIYTIYCNKIYSAVFVVVVAYLETFAIACEGR